MNNSPQVRLAIVLTAMLMMALTESLLAADEAKLFEESIAPVLSAKCIACHQPGIAKGGLDLTTREAMLKGGDSDAGVLPGKPEESPVYQRTISEAGKRPEMPEKGDPLTVKESAALREWIKQGAVWPKNVVLREKSKADGSFWSFKPISVPVPPNNTAGPNAWQSHPIDRFIGKKLEERALKPNGPADARTFIRRATYDLHGLPPSPEDVMAFERACREENGGRSNLVAPQAAAGLVERLLASPHYGERWGRHWLDVVRFGESRGYERNEIITNLWPFRDYVIRSINDDKPFDRFILEHLAGDVIGKDRPEIEVGSAFLVAGPYDDVGNQDPAAAARIRADQMDEMIRATSEAFLGLTMGCARCHDHKFDPLTQRDYYGMFATFAGTVHGPRDVATAEARSQRTGRLKPLESERDRLTDERKKFDAELEKRAGDRSKDAAKTWTRPRHSRYGAEETFETHEAKFVRLAVTDSDNADVPSAFRLDEFEVWTDEPTSRNVALASHGGTAAGASRDAKDFSGAYSAALTIDGKFGERWISPGPTSELLITLSKPTKIRRVFFSADRTRALPEEHPLTVGVGEYRVETSLDGKTWKTVASSADREPKVERLRKARLRALILTEEDRKRLAELTGNLARVAKQIAAVPPLPVWWVGTHRPVKDPVHVHLGGDPQRRGEVAMPASLSVLSSLPSAYSLKTQEDEGARRVALAKWLTAGDHPLTSRVLANRVWHYHFGRGLVDTPSDFGYMGSRPSHPELLDWLANELRRGGWKLKSLHRLIMTSQAYQQSGDWREEATRNDADCRFLWRFPPRRLSAEEIRDTMLRISGKLDTRMGGAGFQLYEYQQDNVATYVPLDRHGPETFRRSVYHHSARAARVDVLTDFDCPDPAFAEPRRSATTSPLQALTLMNHRFSLEMVEALKHRLEREETDPEKQVGRAFELAYSRPPVKAELEAGKKLILANGLRAFCRALLNTNELIHVN
jgi:hypothetical protein